MHAMTFKEIFDSYYFKFWRKNAKTIQYHVVIDTLHLAYRKNMDQAQSEECTGFRSDGVRDFCNFTENNLKYHLSIVKRPYNDTNFRLFSSDWSGGSYSSMECFIDNSMIEQLKTDLPDEEKAFFILSSKNLKGILC